MDKQQSEEGAVENYELRHDANGAYVPLLNQVIGTEGATTIAMGLSRPMEATRPLLMTESLLGVESPAARVGERRRPSTSNDSLTEEERLKRRRQINRNSQRRIRERRAKELEELRSEYMRVRHENDQLHRQNECIAAEKAELLRQLQEITEKWQQTISDNAILNREILQLKARIEEGDVVRSSEVASHLPVPKPPLD